MNTQLEQISLADAFRARRSVRGFLPRPVPDALLREIFSAAQQQAPSNCNTQPWQVWVATGATCQQLGQELYALAAADTPIDQQFGYFGNFTGEHRERMFDCAYRLYGSMGIAREDRPARKQAMLRNFNFFGAPQVAFLCMPRPYKEIIAVDAGIYLQTLLLVMAAHGIGSCAQGALGYYPQAVKPALGIPEEMGILCGISFGYEDVAAPANKTVTDRAALAQAVTFVS
jgi:nitroreductase